MRISYNWLETLLPDLQPALLGHFMDAAQNSQNTISFNAIGQLTPLLNSIGLEVDSVNALLGAPQGVVVAQVLEITPIEDSDHLSKVIVSNGNENIVVVCGATNVTVGMYTALAPVGCHLPALDITVEKRDLMVMGVTSAGMLCSAKELGLFDDNAGIISFSLDEDIAVGDALEDHWGIDTIIELELTPNRADAFSMLGVARDLAAKLGINYHHPAKTALKTLSYNHHTELPNLHVNVATPEMCPRFLLSVVEGVTIAPSPIWLQQRLAALGLKPKNNVVDITNYITFELGQPSHAYDKQDLQNNTITVRWAEQDETLLALNDNTLNFSTDDLLITTPKSTEGNSSQPIGVAGVIGGKEYSVKENTTDIALEVAHFNPVVVRKMAKRLGLHTDAHFRFERGVDPNLPPLATARAHQLLHELAGGKPLTDIIDTSQSMTRHAITFDPSQVAFLTAVEIPLEKQKQYLEALGCNVESQSQESHVEQENLWQVTPPSWRFDLAIPVDITEEIIRLHGYENIPTTLPAMYFVPPQQDTMQYSLRKALAGMGFQETITYAFTGPEILKQAKAPPAHVTLSHPQGVERSVLRTKLYPNLLLAAQNNKTHTNNLAMFEVGKVFGNTEQEHLAILLSGDWVAASWQPAETVDFYLFKGLLETFAQQQHGNIVLKEAKENTVPHLHPGIAATIYWNDIAVGTMGQVHPEVARVFNLNKTFVAEISLPLNNKNIPFKDIVRQPYAERDLAMIVPETTTYQDLTTLIKNAADYQLVALFPFDIYRGEKIDTNHYSIALRMRFQEAARALTDAEVDGFMERIMQAIKNKGYTIRES